VSVSRPADHLGHKHRLLRKVRRAVVKIGSSILSGPDGINRDRLRALAREICDLHHQGIHIVVVSSGAVAAGMARLGMTQRPKTMPQRQAAAAVGQIDLMALYEEYFAAHKTQVAQILLTHDDLASRNRYLNARRTMETLIAAGVLWLFWYLYRWMATRLRSWIRRRVEQLAPTWSRHVVGPTGVERAVMTPLKLVAALVVALVLYEWLAYVLAQFPYTRPWGEALFKNLFDAVGEIGRGIAAALPGLFFVALIFYLTRLVAQGVRAFFKAVEEGRIDVGWVDSATARPTAQLINAVVWLFGFVAAYPYIPGSDSEAFKGIGVFVGLMLSIGSSGIVNQAVSGLMLMYTRALRPGEFVQIGETEGTVRSIGFVNTRIETLRHEEISIPNAVIAGTVTRNFSRLAGDGGVRVPTKVTIGYDAPWRQVRAMLLLAAERTQSVARTPEPRVLQTALQDFYVEYTLLVTVMDPAKRHAVLDELHANIQDVFNENGVQIMSPNYEADPAQPKLVPREDWYKAPAGR